EPGSSKIGLADHVRHVSSTCSVIRARPDPVEQTTLRPEERQRMNALTIAQTFTAARPIVATDLRMTRSKATVVCFWIFTALFCLEMIFTAYYELWILPDSAQAFARLGFPADVFRIELSWAKVAGVAALLLPIVSARLKEWAYAGFAINLVSAIMAHASIHDI